MCIGHDTLRQVMPPGCHPNGGWQLINPGTSTTTDDQLVVACTTCGREWHLRLTAVPLTVGRPQEGKRRSVEDMNRAYEKALALHASGHTIADACRTVDIRREQYTRRRNGNTKGRN